MKSRKWLPTMLVFLAMHLNGPLAWCQSVPNFAGRWVLNAQRSSLSEGSKPERVELNVAQHSKNIECTWVLAPSVRVVLKLRTDGVPTFNPSGGNQEAFRSLVVTGQPYAASPDIESSAIWKSRELRVRTYWMNQSKMGVELIDLWKLSSDKRTLTIERTSGPQHSPSGVATAETRTLLVFERTPEKLNGQ